VKISIAGHKWNMLWLCPREIKVLLAVVYLADCPAVALKKADLVAITGMAKITLRRALEVLDYEGYLKIHDYGEGQKARINLTISKRVVEVV